MKRLLSALHQIATWGSVISFAGLIVVVALQVFARFLLAQAPPWTEEVSRVCFVYMIAFGIGLAVRSDGLVRLDLLQSRSSSPLYKLLQSAILLATSAFAIYLCLLSWQFAANGRFERSPSLGIPMTLVFASMVLLSASISIFSLGKLILTLSRPKPR